MEIYTIENIDFLFINQLENVIYVKKNSENKLKNLSQEKEMNEKVLRVHSV